MISLFIILLLHRGAFQSKFNFAESCALRFEPGGGPDALEFRVFKKVAPILVRIGITSPYMVEPDVYSLELQLFSMKMHPSQKEEKLIMRKWSTGNFTTHSPVFEFNFPPGTVLNRGSYRWAVKDFSLYQLYVASSNQRLEAGGVILNDYLAIELPYEVQPNQPLFTFAMETFPCEFFRRGRAYNRDFIRKEYVPIPRQRVHLNYTNFERIAAEVKDAQFVELINRIKERMEDLTKKLRKLVETLIGRTDHIARSTLMKSD
ncbi:hypothetical protein MHBO_001754 [Bonamia ostreae]|uniref:Uncharacterized protein n=1 Tax=Bonamia ostreae TaxID=126728 RepID=A0ABV2AK28_9EUKA